MCPIHIWSNLHFLGRLDPCRSHKLRWILMRQPLKSLVCLPITFESKEVIDDLKGFRQFNCVKIVLSLPTTGPSLDNTSNLLKAEYKEKKKMSVLQWAPGRLSKHVSWAADGWMKRAAICSRYVWSDRWRKARLRHIVFRRRFTANLQFGQKTRKHFIVVRKSGR